MSPSTRISTARAWLYTNPKLGFVLALEIEKDISKNLTRSGSKLGSFIIRHGDMFFLVLGLGMDMDMENNSYENF